MRKNLAIVFASLCLTWGAIAQTSIQGATFNQTQIGTTNYLQPKLQLRFSSQKFNAPILFDIGGSSSLQNIFQVVPLTTGNTVTFQVVPPSAARTIKFADPLGSTGTVAYLETTETFTGQNQFNGNATFAGTQTFFQATSNQFAIGTTNLDTVSFTAPSANRTLTFPDPGGNASVMYTNATTAQNLLANAFQVSDGTDATKQVKFSASGDTTGTNTTLTFAQSANRVVTFPDASITLNGIVATNCGVSNTCASPATVSSTLKIAYGSCTASAATTCTQSGITPAFTSSSSYFCTASDATTAANAVFKITYVSSSSFSITDSNSSSDVFNWLCWGT